MRLFVFLLALFLSSLIFANEVLATEASFKCSPSTGTFKVGETFTVDYILDTRSFQVFGVAAVSTYDPVLLEVVGTQSTPVTTSTNWGQPTTNTVDTSLGKITLDYGKNQSSWTGSSSIGQITFKAKGSGQAQFNWIFYQQYDNTTPGVAIVWSKKDGTNLSNILTDVNNCIYVISNTTPTSSPTSKPTNAPNQPTSTPPPTIPLITELPRSGNTESTVTFLGIAGIFVLLGTFIPRLLMGKV